MPKQKRVSAKAVEAAARRLAVFLGEKDFDAEEARLASHGRESEGFRAEARRMLDAALQATPPDVRVGEARLRDGLEKAGEALQEARDGLDLGLGCARDVEGDQNPIPRGERAKIADSYLRRSRLAHAEVLRVLASTQSSDGRISVEYRVVGMGLKAGVKGGRREVTLIGPTDDLDAAKRTFAAWERGPYTDVRLQTRSLTEWAALAQYPTRNTTREERW